LKLNKNLYQLFQNHFYTSFLVVFFSLLCVLTPVHAEEGDDFGDAFDDINIPAEEISEQPEAREMLEEVGVPEETIQELEAQEQADDEFGDAFDDIKVPQEEIPVDELVIEEAEVIPFSVLGTNFDDGKWLGVSDGITLVFDRIPDPAEGFLSVFVDNTDMTALFTIEGQTDLVYPGGVILLTPGDHEVIVFLNKGPEDWVEIARLPMQVLTESGFESGEITPRLDVAVNSQNKFNFEKDATKPDRLTFQDTELQAGLTTRHVRGDLEITTSVNISGFSNRQQALRFDERGADTPKYDLNDYLVEVQKGNSNFQLGSVSYGSNPLLISNVSNRGMVASHRINDRLDASFSSMNATSIVGYDNIIGMENINDHNITAGTIGFEFIKDRPGGLRAEVTYMTASKQNETNFNTGEVVDSEKSNGYGISLLGSNSSGRLRGNIYYAESEYVNPSDTIIDPNGDVLATTEETDAAYSLGVAYELFQNYQIGEDNFFNLTIGYNRDKASPLYQSIGAFVTPDSITDQYSISGNFNSISAQYTYIGSQDNIDDIATLLQTKTITNSFSLNVPFNSMFQTESFIKYFLPSASYSMNTVRQKTGNDPAGATSGFNGGSHLPRQFNRDHNLSLSWSGSNWSAGYNYSTSFQNNQQVGRSNDDFKNFGHDFSFSISPIDTLNLNLSYSKVKNKDVAASNTGFTDTYSSNMDWRFHEDWSFNANFTHTIQDDDLGLTESINNNGQAQLNWNFQIPSWGGTKLPASLFTRYSFQESESEDTSFAFATSARTWAVNTGLSISFF